VDAAGVADLEGAAAGGDGLGDGGPREGRVIGCEASNGERGLEAGDVKQVAGFGKVAAAAAGPAGWDLSGDRRAAGGVDGLELGSDGGVACGGEPGLGYVGGDGVSVWRREMAKFPNDRIAKLGVELF